MNADPTAETVGYRLIRDDDGHWYVIPATAANRFHTYVDAASRCEESDEDAKYFGGCRVDGPHAVVFESWRAPR